MAKIRLTQVREFDIELSNYEKVVLYDEPDGEEKTLTNLNDIFEYERQCLKYGDVDFDDADLIEERIMLVLDNGDIAMVKDVDEEKK